MTAHIEAYPVANFPTLWNTYIHDFFSNGDVGATETVKQELEKVDKTFFDTITGGRKSPLFVQVDNAIQIQLRDLLMRFPSLVKDRVGSHADPWAVALARARGLVVVSEERRDPNRNVGKLKIPDVCNEVGLECINFLELIQRENWVV